MNCRFTFFFVLALLFSLNISAQEDDRFSSPMIEDDMTVDAEQNSQWRSGQNKFAAKPKSMWELGLNAGYSFISGDVEAPAFAGYGFGLHLRKSISYVFSLRFEGVYTSSKGFDARFMDGSTLRAERTFQQNGNNQGTTSTYLESDNGIHRNYKTNNLFFSVEGVVNIGNILFHKERNKWGLYGVVGVGLNIPDVNIDLLNGSTAYDFVNLRNGLDLTLRADRKTARERLKNLLDGEYESEGGKENNIITIFGDEKSVLPHINLGLGISKKLSKRVSLGFEYQIMLSDNDLLDGFENRTKFDETNNLDIPHFASVRLGIALGNFEKRAEPLYWLNPLDATFNDIAELKQRPKFDLTDSDGDGVIDMIDQEKDSPAGSPVDTRGVALDSDGDGVLDYKDEEPYSPPGFDVNSAGVAQIPDDGYLTEGEITDLINSRMANLRLEWFLPMIHFDLDKYYVKPEFYGQLQHVASVMKMHPNLKIVAQGYTDNRNSNDYNNVLSYNRATEAVNYIVSNFGIPRDRFYVMYGGEDVTLVSGLPDNHRTNKDEEYKHYMNRRVEFRVAGGGDQDMGRPSGPDAGSNTPGSSRPGTKYSGNRNSGY
jgi:outer membrane protein OmpA-like peptidoglycan-associated protein